MNEWEVVKLGEIINFNPRESISKDRVAKKVAMEKLVPFNKIIDGYELAEFKGGSKFRNGDTLLARITPCLENGKTAKVTILDDEEVGYGSTEYIVMREKLGRTDNDFIYYLSTSPRFRDIAIKSMVGTSGRQRVRQDVLENTMMAVPPITEQKAIAATLSCLDDKIELNNRINKTLEEMAQAIFKSWFVDFEPFQDDEFEDSELGMIPKGWRVVELGDLAVFIKGKKPKTLKAIPSEIAPIKYLTIDALNGGAPQYADADKMVLVNKLDILMVMDGASSGAVYFGSDGVVASTLAKYKVNEDDLLEIVYHYLKAYQEEIKSHNTGSAIPHTDKGFVSRCKILIPDEKSKITISEIFRRIRKLIIQNRMQNLKLTEIRDTLLPKLMSGEIRVPLEEVQ